MSGKLSASQCDGRGRLYLREAIRKKYGENFVVVQAARELILIPVPDDPVASLHEIGKPLQGKSLEEIKAAIAVQAHEEASSGLR